MNFNKIAPFGKEDTAKEHGEGDYERDNDEVGAAATREDLAAENQALEDHLGDVEAAARERITEAEAHAEARSAAAEVADLKRELERLRQTVAANASAAMDYAADDAPVTEMTSAALAGST